jgi:protein-L-isoaspartate(D-aspartate) O-methyltransferase
MPGLAFGCALLLLLTLIGCAVMSNGDAAAPQDETFAKRRAEMVETQIRNRGISDARVLDALRDVPRHRFVPDEHVDSAYSDYPLPIGHGQTISQPYIVGFMSEALRVDPDDRVLEIGTGSGYQAAVLGKLAKEVFTIEIVPELATRSAEVLKELGYDNVQTRSGDGYAGWPEAAPFDAIIVTAAPDHIPQPLIDQLKNGGRLVVPVGRFEQDLLVMTKTDDGLREEARLPVRFVPLTRKP